MLGAFVGGAALTASASWIVATAKSPGEDSVPLFQLRDGELARTGGNLVPGSVRMERECEHRFAVEDEVGFRVPVRLKACVVSDPFEAAAKASTPTPVIVEGVLTPHGFDARGVMVRTRCCTYGPKADAGARRVDESPGRPVPE